MTTAQHVINIIKLVYRRGRRLLAALLLIILIENFWSNMQDTSLSDLQTHSQQLIELTAEQAAHEARHWLIANEQDNLQQLVQQLTQQKLIEYAAIYNNYGQEVVSADAITESPEQAFVIVKEIREGQLIHGYLHITINQDLLLAEPLATHSYLSYYGQFLLVFAVLAGILIAITFNKWRYRRLRLAAPTDNSSAKAASQQ
ncbi:hypothetical protein IDAT_12400 [Pseudidiomarina atlantica]|jgi:uncharacterized membrane protein affecting hemolysin expression|uniref:Smp protein n=1 Tax=Pseudidiomarina atlantica TaxID=1517416 RepID=A0A094KZZ2_9GAMM|nr:hypothetical protein [Pseudidiomarina atlantica]KFZ27878.1 hypothetical protein IDAT_12400 [Pseudidiomarina atlantica]